MKLKIGCVKGPKMVLIKSYNAPCQEREVIKYGTGPVRGLLEAQLTGIMILYEDMWV